MAIAPTTTELQRRIDRLNQREDELAQGIPPTSQDALEDVERRLAGPEEQPETRTVTEDDPKYQQWLKRRDEPETRTVTEDDPKYQDWLRRRPTEQDWTPPNDAVIGQGSTKPWNPPKDAIPRKGTMSPSWDQIIARADPAKVKQYTKVAEAFSRTPALGIGEYAAASEIPKEDQDLFAALLVKQYEADQTMQKAGYGARLATSFAQGAIDSVMPIAKHIPGSPIPELTPEQEQFRQHLVSLRQGGDPVIAEGTGRLGAGVQQAAQMFYPMLQAVVAGKQAGGVAAAAGLGQKGQWAAVALGNSGAFLPQIADQTYSSLIGEGVNPDLAWKVTMVSAPIEAAVESILPDPLSPYATAFKGTVRQVAGKLLKTATVNYTKELTEEGLQGVINETALEVGRWSDEAIPNQGIGNILSKFPEAMKESALPLALLMAPGAGISAGQTVQGSLERRRRLERLREIREKGFVSAEEGAEIGLTPEQMKNRATRKKAVDEAVQDIHKEISDAEQSTEVREESVEPDRQVGDEGGQPVRQGSEEEVREDEAGVGGEVHPTAVGDEIQYATYTDVLKADGSVEHDAYRTRSGTVIKEEDENGWITIQRPGAERPERIHKDAVETVTRPQPAPASEVQPETVAEPKHQSYRDFLTEQFPNVDQSQYSSAELQDAAKRNGWKPPGLSPEQKLGDLVGHTLYRASREDEGSEIPPMSWGDLEVEVDLLERKLESGRPLTSNDLQTLSQRGGSWEATGLRDALAADPAGLVAELRRQVDARIAEQQAQPTPASPDDAGILDTLTPPSAQTPREKAQQGRKPDRWAPPADEAEAAAEVAKQRKAKRRGRKDQGKEPEIPLSDIASSLEGLLGEEPEATPTEALPEIGDNLSVFGVKSTLAGVQEIDGVRYELYNDASLKGKGGAVRIFDADSGNPVEVRRFPDYDAAEAYHTESIRKAAPEAPTTPSEATSPETTPTTSSPPATQQGAAQEPETGKMSRREIQLRAKELGIKGRNRKSEVLLQEIEEAEKDREAVVPAEDKSLGDNAAGEPLYERADGSRYRIHAGKPDFGGDLAPSVKKGTMSPSEAAPEAVTAEFENPKPKKKVKRKKTVKEPETLLAAVQSLGGLSSTKLGRGESVNINEDMKQEGILSAFRNRSGGYGSLDLEEMADELESGGYWMAPVGVNKGDALLAALKDGAKTFAGIEKEVEQEAAAYQAQLEQELRDAEAAGLTSDGAAEAVRAGAEASLGEAEASEGEAAEVLGEVDTSFDFGANVAKPEGPVGVPGQQQALFQADEQGKLFNVSRPPKEADEAVAPSELEKIEDDLKKRKAADKAWDEAKDAFDDLGDHLSGPTLFSTNPFSDPKLVKLAGLAVYKYARAGFLEFEAFLETLRKRIGIREVDQIMPVLESKWDEAYAAGDIEGLKPRVSEDAEEPKGDNVPSEPPVETSEKGTMSPSGDNLSSIKNAMVNEFRAKRGVEPLPETEAETFEEWLDAAMARMDATNRTIGASLVSEMLNPKTRRNLDNIEHTILQVHYRIAKSAYNKAAQELFAAHKAGDPTATAIAQTHATSLSDELLLIEEATKASGKAAGQSLVARRMVLEPDFSLAELTTQARVMNGGRELTPDETAEITRLSKELEATQAKLKEEQEKNIELHEVQKRLEAQIAQWEKQRPKRGVRKPGKKARLQQKAAKAVDTFKDKWAKLFEVGIVPDPKRDAKKWAEITDAAAEVVRAYTALGVYSFGQFMETTVKPMFGGEVSADQEQAFKEAWEKEKEAGNIAVPPLDKTNILAISREARALARAVVEAGVTERDQVVSIVHESLQETLPDLTYRETMDAISGYGQFTKLPKDEVSVTLRDIKGQLQQLGKLDDMQEGRAPSATGFERREQSDEERRLEKQVNEMKKRGGFVITDPESQLKSAMQAAKTAVQNNIADMRYEMQQGERIVREKTELVPDEELERLRKEQDEVREEHKAMFPPPEVTLEQKIEATLRGLNRTIEILEDQLARRDVEYEGKKVQLSTPELDAKRARIQELRALREAMRMDMGLTEARSRRLYEANLHRRIADYEQRIADKDFAPKPKKEPRKLSRAELDLKRHFEDVKSEYFHKLADYRIANLTGWERGFDYARETAHLSRAAMTSVDLSAVFRQGGLGVAAHPVLAQQAGRKMLEAAVSQQAEFDSIEEIRNRPNGQLYETANLAITEREGKATRQEEAFMGRWANKLAQQEVEGAKAPAVVAGKAISISARAYTTFLNNLRADLFDLMVDNLGRSGGVTPDEAKVIAKFVNISTGRGELGAAMKWAENLNAVFFAPRYVISRFQYLALGLQLPFMKTSGRVKKAIAVEYARTAGGLSVFYGVALGLLSLLADDDDEKPTVELDWRSTDFGKIKFGETRIDPLSGLSQALVILGKTAHGQRKTARGEIVDLVGEDRPYGGRTWIGEVGRFAWSKTAPMVSAGIEMRMHEDFVGNETTPAGTILRAFTPLAYRDVKETMMARGIPEGTVISVLALLGMGTATYGPRTQYMTGTESERSDQFAKDLRMMQWDSPDPEYSDMLTVEQRFKVFTRRRQRQAALIWEGAAFAPQRRNYKNDDTFAKGVESHQKAREELQEMMGTMSLQEAKRLLVEQHGLTDGSLIRAIRLNQLYGR